MNSLSALRSVLDTSVVTSGSRSLHWVLKIGNLKSSLNFFEDVLGLRVLRHEEFLSGCEATCNGPYGGAWSKTMIGYGPESTNFALELTYNYGINEYQFGNDLQYIALHNPSALTRAKALNYPITDGNVVHGPDNYKFKFLEHEHRRQEQFAVVALRVANLEETRSYWKNVLGMAEFSTPGGLETGLTPSCVLGFADSQTKLQFIQVQDGQPVNHALSSGRIAFACKSVPPIFNAVTAAGDRVQTPPLTLPTPGKADVVVTILVDRDGYEICFVEDEAFYDLATPLYDTVDFAERASRGGDGHPPPQHTYDYSGSDAGSHGEIVALSSLEEVAKAFEDAKTEGKVALLDFHAGWCKNCKRIAPHLTTLSNRFGEKIKMYSVNIDDSAEIAMEYSVTTLPRLLFFVNGAVVEDYLGSDEALIEQKFASAATHAKK